MPELPDVEHHRRTLAAHVEGEVVRAVHVPDPELLEGATPQQLGQAITGRTLGTPRRYGKWLVAPTTDGGPSLVFHFKMTGELVWFDDEGDGKSDGQPEPAVELRFDHGRLGYRSRRRLGRVHLLPAGHEVAEVTGPLGPDATEINNEELEAALAGRRGTLKSALMDQSVVAGLGNELVDEILWGAILHPRRPASSLTRAEINRLFPEMQRVLRYSIQAGQVPAGPSWLNGRRGDDDPHCPHCGARLEVETISGRTTLWCPREQRLPDDPDDAGR